MRNPKDTAVSLYNMLIKNNQWTYDDTFEDFFSLFTTGFLPNGSWFENVRSWWAMRDRPNVRIIFYEDLKRKPKETLTGEKNVAHPHPISCFFLCAELAKFLETPATDEQIDQLVEFTSLETMRKTATADPSSMIPQIFKDGFKFFRKGEIGDWKNYFTVAMNEIFDEVYRREMKDVSGLEFIYE